MTLGTRNNLVGNNGVVAHDEAGKSKIRVSSTSLSLALEYLARQWVILPHSERKVYVCIKYVLRLMGAEPRNTSLIHGSHLAETRIIDGMIQHQTFVVNL